MSSPLTPPYVTHAGNQTLYLPVSTPIVNTLQALTGSVTLTSPDSSITITPSGQSIQLQTGSSGVQSVSAGTGGVTITGTATDPIVNVTPSTLVISDYTSTAGTLALTGTFVAQGSTTLTTTENSAPINVWGNLNVFHPTGGGGTPHVVEARLVIGTTPQQIGTTVTTTVDSGFYATIPLIYKGTGSTVAGSVNILLQARVISGGTINRVSAQVMAIGQMQNA